MRVRVAVLCAHVLMALSAVAEELGPEQARAFVVGKSFAYSCFDGTAGMGRIMADGSVVGTITPGGRGETKLATLPPGTIKSDGTLCAPICTACQLSLASRCRKNPITKAFAGSIAGLDFAYCDFYQRNPPTQLMSSLSKPAATSIATSQKSPRLSRSN